MTFKKVLFKLMMLSMVIIGVWNIFLGRFIEGLIISVFSIVVLVMVK